MIGKKEIQLLKETSLKKTNLNDLASIMNLSERSIRYKIKNLNEYFKDENLEIKIILKNKVIELNGDLKLLENKEDFSKFNSYIYSQEERLAILLNLLLFNKDKFQWEDYQKLVDISESTFKKDWKLLREKLENLKIKIVNRKYYTVLEASEDRIRTNILKNIVKYKINSNKSLLTNKIIIKIIDDYFENVNFKEIENILKNISKELNIIPSDDALNIIKYTFAISLRRSKNFPLIDKDLKNIEFLRNTEEYKVIKRILKEYLQNLNIKNYDIEILNLTEYFLGSHSYNIKYSFYENWIHIESIVYKIIGGMSKKLGVNFTKDTELFEGILNHIKPMIYRIRKGIKLENSISKEIIEESPEIFQALQENIYILEEFIKCKVEDDELSYLTVFFKLAIKKYQVSKIPRVIIVCSFGYGVSKILEARLKDKFSVAIIKTIPLHELTKELIEKEKIDLVITTTRVDELDLKIPIIKVSPLLENESIEILKEIGLKEIKISDYYRSLIGIIKENCIIKDEEKLKEELSVLFNKKVSKKNNLNETEDRFIDFLSKENVKVINQIENFKEGIEISGQMLMAKDNIKKEYLESCIKIFQEQGAYMIIGANTILPHSDNFKSVKKTDYSFLKLVIPLEIKHEENIIKIENIILLASSDGKNHRNSLLDLKLLIDKYKMEDKIRKCKTEDEILKVLRKLNKKMEG